MAKTHAATTTTTDAVAAAHDTVRVDRAFTRARRVVVLYGIVSLLVLLANIAVTAAGHGSEVSVFMWVRSSLIVATAPLIYALVVRASRHVRSAYARVRTLSIILPIAIVAVDLIPGVCPLWFTLVQVACALALVPVAYLMSDRRVRAVFGSRG